MKPIIGIMNKLDLAFSGVILIILLPALLVIFLFIKIFLKLSRKQSREQVLISITPGSYASAKEKGVEWMFYDKQENGYFAKVITLHCEVSEHKVIRLSESNIIYEIGHLRKRIFSRSVRLTPLCIRVLLVTFGSVFINIKEKTTLVRANDPYISGIVGYIISKICTIPFCVSIHAEYDLQYKSFGPEGVLRLFGSRKLAKRLEKFVLSHTKMVMPIRESLVNYAINHGAKPESIRVIPHGIEPAPFLQKPSPELKKELGIENRKVISFVGRLAKDNYVKDIVEIASQVCQRRKDAVFLMVGDGEERENLEQLSKDLGLNKNVRFLGYQPQDRVVRIRLVSDISLCLMAGFSLIEAAVAGTPVVAYDVDWHYELVKNNETGFLVPEGDIEGAANAILKLLDNPELAKKLGENARKLAVERHSLENTSKIKIKCYEELLSV